MKKKLDTRFPAARIKKIMQSDDNVGKIAMAVPLLVSKALELFLQDLCDRTYEITLKRRAKTLNSFHLKQCIQTFSVFDFLRETVGKVPALGGSDGTGDDCSIPKRRKVAHNEDNNGSDPDFHRAMMQWQRKSQGQRQRQRRSRGLEKESASQGWKFENDTDMVHDDDKDSLSIERLDNADVPEDLKENIETCKNTAPVHNFDLNMDLDESGELKTELSATLTSSLPKTIAEMKHSDKNEELKTVLAVVPPVSTAKPTHEMKHDELPTPEMKHEEFPGWSIVDIGKMDIDPTCIANFNRPIDDEEEDYDEEG